MKTLAQFHEEHLDHMRSRQFSRYTVRQCRYCLGVFLRWALEEGVATPDQLRTARGRLGDTFSYDRLTGWSQASFTKEVELRLTPWVVYRLQPRSKNPPASESLTALEEKIDRLQFHVQTARADFDDKFPGARQKWDAITDLEKQLRELRDTAKLRAAHKPIPLAANASGLTNSQVRR